jgi:eukaryotic-like serine/threonine-protein kinase
MSSPAPSPGGELGAFARALAGQYEVEREVGRGGMGVVYLARDLRLDRLVAIKTLPASLAGDASMRERFLREARTAARLSHPNIVPIHRADEIDGQVFFVMGFVDGDSLAGKVAAGPLAPRDAVPILRDVASALGYAHQRGVIHRDVKMENILLDTVSGRAMVTDFGIARVAAAQPLTATGQILGTVHYLSPEQVSGEDVDPRSDVYSLGVVGYALLSGRFPFDSPLASAVLVAHVTKPPPPLASAAPHVPASLADVIDRCLAKHPDDRFQSCAEFEAALDAVRGEANAVATAPRYGVSPLLSDTEAQDVLLRAATLDVMTSARQRPAIPMERDRLADAARREGFKTSVLRESAAEVGIHPQSMEQALAEHGLRPTPVRNATADRHPPALVHDLTQRPGPADGEPTEIRYEMIFNGEVSSDDYGALLNVIRDHWKVEGVADIQDRTLTWTGAAKRRFLEVLIDPRGGRTTIQVVENFRKTANLIYIATVGVLGLGVGGMFTLQSLREGQVGPAVVVFVTMLGIGCMTGLGIVGSLSRHRALAARRMLEALGALAREFITARYYLK